MHKIFFYAFFISNLLTKYSVSQEEVYLDLFFSSESFTLSAEEQGRQATFIKNLDSNLIFSVSIYGYCDDRASTQFNDSLSLKRAIYIKNRIIDLGIKSTLITEVEGKGEVPLQTLSTKDSIQQRSLNRMARIIIKTKPILTPPKELNFVTPQKDITAKEYPRKIPTRKTLNDDLKVGDTIVFEEIQFLDNRHKIHPKSYPTLDSIVKNLKMKPQYDILIMGHICCVAPDYKGRDALDTDTSIENLSEARAKAVVDYLVKKGIKSKRLSYIGLKGFYPTGKGEFFDRRVEIKITNIKY
jgi:outer membrane protein OmpA-like peptidoglycan-associated protein